MTDASDRYVPPRQPLHIVPPEVPPRASERQWSLAVIDKLSELVSAVNRLDNDVVDLTAARIVDDGHRRRLADAVDRLTKRLDGPEFEQRARQASSQEIQVAADELRAATEAIEDATEELTSPGMKRPSSDSDRIRAMTKEALDAKELAEFREQANRIRSLKWTLTATIIGGLILTAVTTYVAHYQGRAVEHEALTHPSHP